MRKVLFYFLLLIIFSCQSNQKSNSLQDASELFYSFQKVDSLSVKDILARVFIFQGEKDQTFFFRDRGTTDVYQFDKEGNLIDKWNKEGDVPGQFSMAARNLEFDQKGNLVILDNMHGLKIMKKDGEVVRDFPIYHYQMSLAGMIGLFHDQQVINKNGKEYLLYSLDIIEDTDGGYTPEFLVERKSILLTDLETNETKKFIPFPKSTGFLEGKVYLHMDIRPVIFYDEGKEMLYLMFKGSPILYTYDWSGDSPVLIDEMPLALPGFEVHEGFEPGEISLGQLVNYQIQPFPSRVENIAMYKGDLLISYTSTPADKSAISKVIEKTATKETRSQLAKEAGMKTVLLKSTGELSPVLVPELANRSFHVQNDKIYWMKKPNPDEEAENFTVYWGELKVE